MSTKLHEQTPPAGTDAHDDAWALIPWYVNGSLGPDEAGTVKTHAQGCALCAAEIGRQRLLAEKVAKTDPFDAAQARSWNTLRSRIAAEDRARIPARLGWADRLRGVAMPALGGAVCAALALVAVLQFGGPGGDDFVTLTSEEAGAALTIRLQPAAGVDADALRTALERFGVTAVNGPSEAGVFRVSLSEDADVAAVAQAMMDIPEVLFAAPEAGQ